MPIRRNPGSCCDGDSRGGSGGNCCCVPGTAMEISSGSFSGPFVPLIQRDDCPPVLKLVTHIL
jgi:hypothetical protein